MAVATAPTKPATESPDLAARREVTRMLKGPVAEKFKSLIPPLAEQADPYKIIMETPDLLDACFQLFEAKRDIFAEFLVDANGNPVTDDAVRLRCGRSITEVIGMVVRTGMRAYAELHFGDPIVPAKVKAAKAAPKKRPPKSGLLRFIDIIKIADLFKKNYGTEKPLPVGQSRSGRFYAAIKDALDFSWQVRFFPIYVEIPPHVFDKLGVGITRMDTEERLHRLAQLAIADINRAEAVIKDPALTREMIDNNVLASATVTELGEKGFENIHGALDHLDAKKKWDVLANRETALRLNEDKRITKSDIVALAEYLDVLNEFALDAIFDLKLNRDQMGMFLKTAEENLGRQLFLALFGPIPSIIPTDPDEVDKLRRYQKLTQNSLRNLVSAVKQLDDGLRKSGGAADLQDCLATVCRARRLDLEKEVKKLAPASLGT